MIFVDEEGRGSTKTVSSSSSSGRELSCAGTMPDSLTISTLVEIIAILVTVALFYFSFLFLHYSSFAGLPSSIVVTNWAVNCSSAMDGDVCGSIRDDLCMMLKFFSPASPMIIVTACHLVTTVSVVDLVDERLLRDRPGWLTAFGSFKENRGGFTADTVGGYAIPGALEWWLVLNSLIKNALVLPHSWSAPVVAAWVHEYFIVQEPFPLTGSLLPTLSLCLSCHWHGVESIPSH